MRAAVLAACGCVAAVLCGPAVGAPPAGWRGDGTGRFPQAAPPRNWDIDEKTHIAWRTVVGKGFSSPVVAGGRVYVSAEQDLLLCLDGRTGKLLWRTDNGFASLPAEIRAPEKRYTSSCGYSTPTPVADGNCVYASYGTGIVVCCDPAGTRKWVRYFATPQVTEYGRTASPVLAGGRLLVSLGGLIALDPATGRTIWQATDAKASYGTPALARLRGEPVAVTAEGDCVRLSDGKIVASSLGTAKYASPVVQGDVVYFLGPPAVAVKLPAGPAGKAQPARLWQQADLKGDFHASPLWHDGLLYCLGGQGVLHALDAATGKTVFTRKLPTEEGAEPPNFFASPALVGPCILVCDDTGCTWVLAPGRAFKQLAINYLDSASGACPTPDAARLLLRGETTLTCIAYGR